jgi:hypothetical protein
VLPDDDIDFFLEYSKNCCRNDINREILLVEHEIEDLVKAKMSGDVNQLLICTVETPLSLKIIY